MSIVTTIDTLVKKMKDNVRKMEIMMKLWENPLYDRKLKPFTPEDFEQIHSALVISRLDEVKN